MSAPLQIRTTLRGREIPTRSVVGPNAIIQLAVAISLRCGTAVEQHVFAAADLGRYLQVPPTELVPENDVALLFATTRSVLHGAEADAVLAMAGSFTADYITTHRIPHWARRTLRLMPPWIAAHALLASIRAHAWTFAGSGVVEIEVGRRPSLIITDNPLATPGCHWHVAVLQRLFRNMVAPAARVAHSRLGSADRFCIETLARG